MKKRSIIFSLMNCAVASFAATTVNDVTVIPGDPVAVNYVTAGDDAIVTVSFSVDGVALGDAAMANVYGDVNMVVPAGGHTLYWPAQAEYAAAGSVTATVTAWPTNDPPDYVVFDLTTKRRRFYTSIDAFPRGGIDSDLYRTDQVVMRRIPAAGVVWMRGSGPSEIGRYPNTWSGTDTVNASEYGHNVQLTNDYYMSVFEATQYQTLLITNNQWFTEVTNRSCWATRPADHINFRQIRGHKWKAGDGRATSANCVVRYAQRIMDGNIDLPTDAQWEYACRAGTTTATWFGDYPDESGNYESLNAYARYLYNGGNVAGTDETTADYSMTTSGGTARVGTYLPNPWGLYDMLGNVSEYVLDGAGNESAAYYVFDANNVGINPKNNVTYVNPEGCPTNCSRRIMRGGNWLQDGQYCRSAYRAASKNRVWDTINPRRYGYRLVWHFANPEGLTTANSTYGTTNRPFATPASATSAAVALGTAAKGETALSTVSRIDLFEIGDYVSDETAVTTLPCGSVFMIR